MNEITLEELTSPPEWLVQLVSYYENHGQKKAITAKTLAQEWEGKIGRDRKRRLLIVGKLLGRPIASFKELSQAEASALHEVAIRIRVRGKAAGVA